MDSITIEIHNSDTLVNWLYAAMTIAFAVWLALLLSNPSVAGFFVFVLFTAAAVLFIFMYEKKPTIIRADSEKLTYRHLLPEKSIRLSDITLITCEPYTVQGRYCTYQRIKLYILTKDDEECEFNDNIDAGGLVSDILDSRQTEIPLITLYNFLKQRTGL